MANGRESWGAWKHEEMGPDVHELSLFKRNNINIHLYSLYINHDWNYIEFQNNMFNDSEITMLESLIESVDYDNYLIAKAIIDEREKI